jgi:hypothetical protein
MIRRKSQIVYGVYQGMSAANSNPALIIACLQNTPSFLGYYSDENKAFLGIKRRTPDVDNIL